MFTKKEKEMENVKDCLKLLCNNFMDNFRKK